MALDDEFKKFMQDQDTSDHFTLIELMEKLSEAEFLLERCLPYIQFHLDRSRNVDGTHQALMLRIKKALKV